MPDAFFQSQKKRKRPNRAGGSSSRPAPRKPRAPRDEELASDDEGGAGNIEIDDMDFTAGRRPAALDDDEFVDTNETAAEKRVRLARGYLDKVRQDIEEGGCRATGGGLR